MTHLTLTAYMDGRNRILAAPEGEMKDILLEGLAVFDSDPTICKRIEKDVEAARKAKKRVRLADAVWEEEQTPELPGMVAVTVNDIEALDDKVVFLGTGRPRSLDAEAIFVFMLCRGHLDSVTSKNAIDRLRDSILIRSYLEGRNMSFPCRSTIHAYLNVISDETRSHILEVQLRRIVGENLDDMSLLAIDSLSVSASSSWPTDSKILQALLARAYGLGRSLGSFDLPAFTEGCIPQWLRQLKQLDFKIATLCGKAHSRRRMKRLYKEALVIAEKVVNRMVRQVNAHEEQWRSASLPPSKRWQLDALIERIDDSLQAALRVCTYTEERVCHGVQLPAADKVLSLSDESAAYIKKGGRDAVIGYKPQLARSGNGFITAFEVREGNPNDSKRLVPMVEQHRDRVGSVPSILTVDDGYSSGNARNKLLEMGIDVVSINGSKGKKITPAEEWESDAYRQARCDRSAVESLMFTMRFKFHLDKFTRRGIEAVQAELTEKVIAYNCWRASLLRRRAAAAEIPSKAA